MYSHWSNIASIFRLIFIDNLSHHFELFLEFFHALNSLKHKLGGETKCLEMYSISITRHL